MPTKLNQVKNSLHEPTHDYFQDWGWDVVYSIGYEIVQDFIKNNPDVGFEEWSKMPAAELFERSGWKADD